MVRFFQRDGEVHPIRNSPGYDPSEDDPSKPHRRRIPNYLHRENKRELAASLRRRRAEIREQEKQIRAERIATQKAERAAERAKKEKAKKDAQAKRAEMMYRKWEEKEEKTKAAAELRKQKQYERERRIMDEEEHRERRRIAQERKRLIQSFINRGVAPNRGQDEEWRNGIPRRYRNRRSPFHVDEIAHFMNESAPHLGIHNEADFYAEMDRWQRGIFTGIEKRH